MAAFLKSQVRASRINDAEWASAITSGPYNTTALYLLQSFFGSSGELSLYFLNFCVFSPAYKDWEIILGQVIH